MKARGRLAKLTPPRLAKPLLRERLFRRLDEARAAPCLWVAAAPGAGKTVLAASYLAARKAPAVWMQLDGADSDAPAFFYYLREAALGAQAIRARGLALDLLTPELQPGLAAYARRFFRALFAAARPGTVFVFDNAQELAEGCATWQALSLGIAELPEAVSVFVLSRTEPGPEFAHARVGQQLGVLGGDALLFDREEIAALAQEAGEGDWTQEQVEAVHRATEGWAAGVRLMLAGSRARASPGAGQAPEALFQYFATEVFDAAAPRWRAALARLAFVSSVSVPVARMLSQDEGIGPALGQLAARRLFTYEKPGQQPRYAFHPLFREFLRARAQAEMAAPELARLRSASAAWMEQEGELEAAFDLYAQAGDWPAAERWILAHAQGLIAAGRWAAVTTATAALPEDRLEASAWLRYWAGAALTAVEPKRARAELERAHETACRAGDRHAELQCAALIVQGYLLEYSHFAPLDRWIAALEPSMTEAVSYPDADAELAVVSALLVALSFRQPLHPLLNTCVERTIALIGQATQPDLRASAAANVVAFGSMTGTLALADRMISTMQALAADPRLTPFCGFWCRQIETWYWCIGGRTDEALRAVERLAAWIDRYALEAVRRSIAVFAFWTHLMAGHVAAARESLFALEATANPTLLYDAGAVAIAQLTLHTVTDEFETAVQAGSRSVAILDEAGSSMHRIACRHWLVVSAASLGDRDLVRRMAVDLEQLLPESEARVYSPMLLSSKAIASVRIGDYAAALAGIRQLLAHVRIHSNHRALCFHWRWMPELCLLALETDTEAEQARFLVRTFGWPAPPGASERWPWPLKIHTLGTFQVLVDGEPLAFGRKAPRRLLLLLEALVAFGGEDVPRQRIADLLWPDQEGDAAQAALDVALRRLRELLGHAEAVAVADGRISLDRGRVWTDAWAFEHLLASNRREDHEQAIALYRGPFLAGEPDARWAVPPRERLRRKFTEAVARHAAHLEAEGARDRAAACYLRGIEADDLAESLYQGLMRCHLAQGRAAEAASVFRQLTRVLSVVLGVEPSEASRRLYRDIIGTGG